MKVIKKKLSTVITKGFIEFLLIVFGVTIALWLENVAEDFKEREIEEQYLIGFHADVSKDMLRLNQTIKTNSEIRNKIENLMVQLLAQQLTKENFPNKANILMNYDYFSPDDFTLSSIRESGDFRLLQDIEIKRKIIQLKRAYDNIYVLQDNFQKALDNQIVPMIIKNVDLINDKLVNEDFLNDIQLSNIVGYSLNDIKVRIKNYKYSLEIAQELKLLLETAIQE